MNQVILYIFSTDLRLHDNLGLQQAMRQGPVLPLFLWDHEALALRSLGAASRSWLHHSLTTLATRLRETGGQLLIQKGDPAVCLTGLLTRTGIRFAGIYAQRAYGPDATTRSRAWRVAAAQHGIPYHERDEHLLWLPGSLCNQAGQPYQIFTPFWRALRSCPIPAPPGPLANARWWVEKKPLPSLSIDTLGLLPTPRWDQHFYTQWQPGEKGAWQAFQAFRRQGLALYHQQRHLPAVVGTSALSPHLAFGEISVRRLWHEAMTAGTNEAVMSWLAELAWREFAFHTLDRHHALAQEELRPEFRAFPWRQDVAADIGAWQKGLTGYPIVDAGMRQLWATGWMHNRVRMIVASFLVKHLLVDWRVGEAWFWDTLLDACPANNPQNWQWVSGSGRDAAPYFRIFNPNTQASKFDPTGAYIRRWVPELARLPAPAILTPWSASASTLAQAGVVLGQNYPTPLVSHELGRLRALTAYARLPKRAAT